MISGKVSVRLNSNSSCLEPSIISSLDDINMSDIITSYIEADLN